MQNNKKNTPMKDFDKIEVLLGKDILVWKRAISQLYTIDYLV